jgi:hypothetical protein
MISPQPAPIADERRRFRLWLSKRAAASTNGRRLEATTGGFASALLGNKWAATATNVRMGSMLSKKGLRSLAKRDSGG